MAKPSKDAGRQAPPADAPASGPPSLQLPKGGGAIRGIGEKFTASPVTGTGSLSVPVATSAGRSGMAPRLSLSYDSGAGNGPFGFGWSLSLPSITRKTDKGLPRYADATDSDVFILAGAEDLVPLGLGLPLRTVDGTSYRIDRYRPRTEGLFARIERWTSVSDPADVFWRSISKDNITSWYGKTAASRIADPADARRIFSWLLCQVHDDKGNVVVYDYKEEDSARIFEDAGGAALAKVHERNRTDASRAAQRYPKRIRYGNRTPYFPVLQGGAAWPEPADGGAPDASGAWCFEVIFDYGEHQPAAPLPGDAAPWGARRDPFSSCRGGFEVRTYRLCRRVLMFHHFPAEAQVGRDCLVCSTNFTYSDDADPDDVRNPVYTFLRAITHAGYRRQAGGYEQRSLPPLEFEYTTPEVQRVLEEVGMDELPAGPDGGAWRWNDLHGEGVPGILVEQGGAWFYKRNLSPLPGSAVDGREQLKARFAPFETVARRPAVSLAGGAQLMDLAGDGLPDVVVMEGPMAGLYEHDEGEGWDPFRPFASHLQRGLDDPNLRFVDLDGDGHPDLLVTEDDAFVWHASLAEEGFGPARRVAQALDEERGPRIVFADGSQSIYLADLSGDGLTDIVRIRNGEICYWPNLGYGHFGPKVTMDRAPWFDHPDQFDHRRVRLADIDGSGTTDIIYLHGGGARLYFNQSGNSWSQPQELEVFPRVDDLVNIAPMDLLGNGTCCLVWSSPLPGDARRPLRYVNLMGGCKPHLLVGVKNNLGAETRVEYVPSTRFYLQDKRDGKPWATRLAFPVQVVERVETYDRVSGNRFVSRYQYHHGYFDGEEREFRGFGMVEQRDTEEIASVTAAAATSTGTNLDAASYVPPVLTRTWFHTGASLAGERISRQFEDEYFREPGSSIETARARLLPDTVLPAGLTAEEEREACRALKGSMLRQEVYALDGVGQAEGYPAGLPYSVTEQNFTIERLQPRAAGRHAVFLVHPRESLSQHYERSAADPRIEHALTLQVDSYGNVLAEAAIGYGRRVADPGLPSGADRATQQRALLTCTERAFTNAVDDALHPDDYRIPLASEARTYELTLADPPGSERLGFETVRQAAATATPLDYELAPSAGQTQKRPIEHVRTRYRSDNLVGLLPQGGLEPLALPGESYKLAYTPGLLAQVFEGRVADAMLRDEGGYVHLDGDANWWIPSGRVFYSPAAGATAQAELDHARGHFFLPHRYRDPFGALTFVAYDSDAADPQKNHNLLVVRTEDAVGNVATAANDYRVLQPRELADPNGNRSAVRFDALGLVVGTAVMGKAGGGAEGDSFDDFAPDLASADIRAYFDAADPRPLAALHLGTAGTRILYDLERTPACAATIARETHASDLAPGQQSKLQLGFSYSDGFGREVQKKMQAEPGPAPQRTGDGKIMIGPDGLPVMTGHDVTPRWVGSGWTVFNNKGKPVRQFEPFFSDTHKLDSDARIGVSPWLFYDPVGRVALTLQPEHTWEKVAFTAWSQTSHDVNDTVLTAVRAGDPGRDPVAAGFLGRLPDAEYLPTWHELRTVAAHAAVFAALYPDARDRDNQARAAGKAAAHAGTPASTHFDALGRSFLTVGRNRVACPGHSLDGKPDEDVCTRVEFDIEGNEREVRDERKLPDADGLPLGAPEQRVVMRHAFDMLGNRARHDSMEAGARWILGDVAGKPVRAWDSRGHILATRYDALRRPLEQAVRGTTTDSDPRTLGRDLVVDRIEYGEGLANARLLNLRTRVYRHFDTAGVAVNARLDAAGAPAAAYDFKGNLLHSTRRLLVDYSALPDWMLAPQLEDEVFEASFRYDALNRPVQSVAPHGSLVRAGRPGNINVIQPVFNEANLLERLDVWLERASEPMALLDPAIDAPSPAGVANIDYDAKGQRQRIDYRNGASTTYAYDRFNLRLVQLLTRRNAVAFPGDDPEPPSGDWPGRQVQNLRYTYDPAGNITHILDDAQQAVYFRNQRVEPAADYVYDALYRLVQASGREHLGQLAGGARQAPTSADGFNAFHTGLAHPGDGQAMGTYIERYVYDAVGNFLQMQHRGTDPAHPGWVRAYEYLEPSLLEDGSGGAALRRSNRLSRTALNPNGAMPPQAESHQYDVHGNVVRLPHLGAGAAVPNVYWDYKDQLRRADRGTGVVYCAYDASGQRVRKVWEKAPGVIEERIYLGGVELFRKRGAGADTTTLERETLHVIDDKQRIALVEMRTLDTTGADPAPRRLIRYQHGNHLGSASLELDEAGNIISYEEYAPFGSSTYQAVRNQMETAKRYRYTGKERDEETGLYYHGARYYMPWLGRWSAPDPAGIRAGINLYAYCRNSPVKLSDPSGMDPPDDQRRPFRLTPLATTYSFRNRLSSETSISGRGAIEGEGRGSFQLQVPALGLTTTGFAHASGVAAVDTGLGQAAVHARGGVLLGEQSGLHLTAVGELNLTIPVPERLELSSLPGPLLQGIPSGTGDLRFAGNLAYGNFSLANVRGNVSLAGGRFEAQAQGESLGNIAQFRLNASGSVSPQGDISLESARLRASVSVPGLSAEVNLTGTATPGGSLALRGVGNVQILGLPSLHLEGTGSASTEGASFSGRFYGAGPLYTSAITGRFTASTEHGISGEAGVFGLTYTPGVDVTESNPPRLGYTASEGAATPWTPSGLTLGASYFHYSQGQLSHISLGIMPDLSERILTNPRFGVTAGIHF